MLVPVVIPVPADTASVVPRLVAPATASVPDTSVAEDVTSQTTTQKMMGGALRYSTIILTNIDYIT